MLVGNTASGFFLVHSETIDNPYVASRPFRVNAGAVHAYTLTPGSKTKYLADLKAGDEVMLVNFKGKSQTAYLGRNKIEKRPMMLIEADFKGSPVSLVLQNAETIRLVNPEQSTRIVGIRSGYCVEFPCLGVKIDRRNSQPSDCCSQFGNLQRIGGHGEELAVIRRIGSNTVERATAICLNYLSKGILPC